MAANQHPPFTANHYGVSTAPEIIKVLLVDDHAVVRAGYRRLLDDTSHIKVIAEAETGRQGYERYIECMPDVVVMDLSLPDISGIEAMRRITAYDSEARILVFSMHEEPAFAERAAEAGARGYITKSSAPEVLVEAVQRVARGEVYLGSDMARRFAARRSTDADELLRTLSLREFEILRLLAAGRTVNEIAESLCLGHKTIANYSTQIKSKLGVATNAELVWFAIRHRLISP